MDRIGVRGRGKSCAARPWEQGRHAYPSHLLELSILSNSTPMYNWHKSIIMALVIFENLPNLQDAAGCIEYPRVRFDPRQVSLVLVMF